MSNYNLNPAVVVTGYDDAVSRGWPAVSACLSKRISRAGAHKFILAIECYSGVLLKELEECLISHLQPIRAYATTRQVFKDPRDIDALVAGDMGGDDPIFGRYSRLELGNYFDPARKARVSSEIAAMSNGLIVVFGPGASLLAEADLLIYADMPRWEEQLRQRAGKTGSLGVNNAGTVPSLLYKRSFFVDWRACDRLKRKTLERWDYFLDTTVADDPRLLSGEALRAGLRQTVQQPFRVKPFFDPGPWGGQWMKDVCGLDRSSPNYAWCFDCVPEENSLVLQYGDERVELPSQNLVYYQPRELLGEGVFGRFGAEFPIRFDFLDTMGGGNLSFQVHPLLDYAREHFGLHYTQDESYYILDAGKDATVFLGLKDGVKSSEMMGALEVAQAGDVLFDDQKFVVQWPSRKHDHFLIPAGMCHCSGANSMVLEISHTPYIFTFKLWDWARLGMDGKPRPINLRRGSEVIQWDRTEDWVRRNLVNNIMEVSSGDGWREERTGLYESQSLETRRHWFSKTVAHDTKGNLNVLNLVQGKEAIVKSPDGAFAPFPIHYVETFIIPAALGPYTISPVGDSIEEYATLKAYTRIAG